MKPSIVSTSLMYIFTACFGMAIITSCGKHETTGGVMGTTTGAIIGASVANRKNTATGALIGGLIGNAIGRSIGQEADEDERQIQYEHNEKRHTQRHAMAQQKIDQLKYENRILKQKWCPSCNHVINLVSAKSCPSCGSELIRERYCRECSSIFSPQSGYRYCPYCKQGTRLATR